MTTHKTKRVYYRNGEQIAFTGKVTPDGANGKFARLKDIFWYEFEVVADSHRIGWKGVTPHGPDSPYWSGGMLLN